MRRIVLYLSRMLRGERLASMNQTASLSEDRPVFTPSITVLQHTTDVNSHSYIVYPVVCQCKFCDMPLTENITFSSILNLQKLYKRKYFTSGKTSMAYTLILNVQIRYRTLNSGIDSSSPTLGMVVLTTWAIFFTPLCLCILEETPKSRCSILSDVHAG